MTMTEKKLERTLNQIRYHQEKLEYWRNNTVDNLSKVSYHEEKLNYLFSLIEEEEEAQTENVTEVAEEAGAEEEGNDIIVELPSTSEAEGVTV